MTSGWRRIVLAGVGVVAALYLGWLGLKILAKLPEALLRLADAVRSGAPLTPNPPLHRASEALLTLAIIIAWSVLAFVGGVPRLGPVSRAIAAATLGGRLSLAAVVLPLAGVAMLIVLILSFVAPATPNLLVVALAGAVVLMVVAVALAMSRPSAGMDVAEPGGEATGVAAMRGTGKGAGDEAAAGPGAGDEAAVGTGAAPQLPPRARRVGAVASVLAIGLLGWAFTEDAIHLAVFRPSAFGDEAYFWYRATETMHQLGFVGYVAAFPVANYSPGFPLLANLLLGWLPDGWFEPAFRAFPFMVGITLIGLLLRPLGRGSRPVLSVETAGACLLVFLVIAKQSWVHRVFFQLWYGETMAIGLVALLLLLLDRAARPTRQPARGELIVLAFLAVGVGAFAVLSKPPLSTLLIPAILPTLVLGTALVDRARTSIRRLLIVAVVAGAGGLVAQQVWGRLLSDAGRTPFYAFDPGTLLVFHPNGNVGPMLSHSFTNYDAVWVGFALAAGAALALDWRRFLPGVLVVLGMMAAIVLLYLGPWYEVEYESGSRYFLHSALGWLAFALPSLVPGLSTSLRRRFLVAPLRGLPA